MVDTAHETGRPRPAAASHAKAFFIGIALFLVTGLGLGLMGFLVGAAGDAAAPVGGAQVPIEVASAAFFALLSLLLSPFVALAVGIAIGAADGRNPVMRGIIAGLASFVGFFLLVATTILVSGAEVGNTLREAFNLAGTTNLQTVLTRLFVASLPAAGIGLLTGALTALMWPRRDPYYTGYPTGYGAGPYATEEYRRPATMGPASAAGFRGGETYRGETWHEREGTTPTGWTRPTDARDQGVLYDEPGRVAGERPQYGSATWRPPPEERGVYRGRGDRDVYWEQPRGERRIDEERR